MKSHSTEIVPGSIFFSNITDSEREKDGFFETTVLVLQISGQLMIETSEQKISVGRGQILLSRKNQLVKVTKSTASDGEYRIIYIFLDEGTLRQYALENGIEATGKYLEKPNMILTASPLLRGYFHSLTPYIEDRNLHMNNRLGSLKVKEAIELLLLSSPQLKNFLFDFSEPHKIDLEKFMLKNFRFNVPIDKFATLTGRSLAGFKRDFRKTFNMPPRQWLQDKRLTEAYYQMETHKKRPSDIYQELGFETLAHFSYAFKAKYGASPTKL